MSYCRWSSDDYRCDLYVYDSCYDNTTVHIASNRHTIPDDALPPPLSDDPEWITKWIERHKIVHDLLEQYPRVPIGGPFDGQSFTFDDPSDAANWIESELVPLGVYRFPDDLVAALREEETE